MYRSITVLFQRDESRDRQNGRIWFAGYRLLWPDGRPIEVGVEALCRHGQRLLGLDRHLAGVKERLIELLCFSIADFERPMTRLAGHRVRRFFLNRDGVRGRLHFLDGTPTEVDFMVGRDEPTVLDWIGLAGMPDHARLCLDLAGRPFQPISPVAAAPFGTPETRLLSPEELAS